MNSKRPQSVRPIPAVEGQETLEEGMMNAAFADEERNAEHDLARETDFVNADTEHPDPGRSFRSPEISMPPGFIPNITLGHQGKSIQNQEQVSTEIDGSQPPAGQNQQNRMPVSFRTLSQAAGSIHNSSLHSLSGGSCKSTRSILSPRTCETC